MSTFQFVNGMVGQLLPQGLDGLDASEQMVAIKELRSRLKEIEDEISSTGAPFGEEEAEEIEAEFSAREEESSLSESKEGPSLVIALDTELWSTVSVTVPADCTPYDAAEAVIEAGHDPRNFEVMLFVSNTAGGLTYERWNQGDDY